MPGGLWGGCLRLAFIYRGCRTHTHTQEWIYDMEHVQTTQLKQRQTGETQDLGERRTPRNRVGGGPACSRGRVHGRRPHPRGTRVPGGCRGTCPSGPEAAAHRIPGAFTTQMAPDRRGYARNWVCKESEAFLSALLLTSPLQGRPRLRLPLLQKWRERSRPVSGCHFLMP